MVLYDPFRDQLETFIRVGEYPLAIDGIAGLFLENKVSMPPDLFRRFERLADAMDLASDPEYQAVAEFRKAQATPT